MPHLHQLRVKLLNAIERGVPGEVEGAVDEIFMSMGNCEKCYGRGYLISGNTGAFCDCDRAEKLKNFIKVYHAEPIA